MKFKSLTYRDIDDAMLTAHYEEQKVNGLMHYLSIKVSSEVMEYLGNYSQIIRDGNGLTMEPRTKKILGKITKATMFNGIDVELDETKKGLEFELCKRLR